MVTITFEENINMKRSRFRDILDFKDYLEKNFYITKLMELDETEATPAIREKMKETDIKFLESAFKKYYFEQFDLIRVPERTSEREFGYQKFNSGMTRHISVKDDKELHLLLMQNVPSDVYCSNAYYSFPNLPMNEKDWKEADLIFDIDAKDLNLSCRSNHTLSVCNECHEISNNSEKCSK